MTARRAVTRLLSLSARALTGVCGVVAVGWGFGACYSAGSGANPPANILYFPVGVAVSGAGDYLYVANSDFDLQWNGGTLQSYDLTRLRHDTASLIFQNLNPGVDGGTLTADAGIPFVFPPNCLGQNNANPEPWPNGQRPILGESCSPPVDSTKYVIESAVIGAFASDLQLSVDGKRLFVPVRGDATLTWASLVNNAGMQLHPPASPAPPGTPLTFDCGQYVNGNRCGKQVGNDPNAFGDTRHITLPGEPFGMAQSEDGTAIAITQQATQETSLLLAGQPSPSKIPPSMQFVLEGVPTGGNGIVAVPHDPDAVRRCEDPAVNDMYPCVRPAFLQTSRNAGEVDLLRYYDDEGSSLHVGSSLRRPFLVKEFPFPVTVNTPGTDQRGIVIDPTPRLKCKAQALAANKGVLSSTDAMACGQIPARVFIGSRSPASVIYGTIGGPSPSGDYDPDQLNLLGSVPLLAGPSRLYLAPIVDATGHYALRLFVVCYDSNVVFVFDPELVKALGQTAEPEAVLNVGPGPFAMAFDPFCNTANPAGSMGTTGLVDATGQKSRSAMMLDCTQYGPFADVAVSEAHAGEADFLVPVGTLPNDAAYGLRGYRFGYLTSFTQSYIQVLDLDDSLKAPPPAAPAAPAAPARSQQTFEDVVFTFGNPTPPKGT